MPRSTTIRRDEQGQAATEFALVLPLLALLLFGVIQFGIVFRNYLTVTDAVRTGSRVAAVSRQYPDRVARTQNAVRNAARDLSGTVSVSVSSTWAPGADVVVTASYPYSINLLGRVVRSGQLTSSNTERVE
jgi:Flp pilus assembly protein TadG